MGGIACCLRINEVTTVHPTLSYDNCGVAMDIKIAKDLFQKLLVAKSSSDVRAILEMLGDHQGLGLDEPFGPFQFCWHAFNDNPSNLSSIGLGTKPGKSLTERLTNAVDAVLEDRAPQGVPLPGSARFAAQQWFGRPISGPDDGLFNWNYAEQENDRKYSVVMLDSSNPEAPTIDVIDNGIGISPEDFPGTILSLQRGNKIQKWHLIGAFGQGGASTLAFSEFAIVISRHRDNSSKIGFTIIKVLSLNEDYKEDCFAYLCLRDSSGRICVPSCQVTDRSVTLYPQHPTARVPSFDKGTLIRHITYQLPKLNGKLGPGPGNLYHYLHCSAFDPLLPFRLVDLRESEVNNQIVTGSRNRLMKLEDWNPSLNQSGTFLRYYREMEYFVPHGATAACIGIEFWVVYAYRKGPAGKSEQVIMRPQSNELFITTGHPILGTLNGQNQGELTAQLLRNIQLGMVARHMIVHIDASRADSTIRRKLFSTDREQFKDGPVLDSLVQMLEKMLGEDDVLHQIERELTEKLAKREVQSTSETVKRQIVNLLREAGLELKKEGPTNTAGAGEKSELTKRSRGGRTIKPSPLPTLPFPQVTKFEIVYPESKFKVHIGDSETVLIHTDADAEFARQGRLAIRSEPDCLELAGQSNLKGGRARWRLRPNPTAKIGDVGRIIASITKPDGTQLQDDVEYEILAQEREKTKQSRGTVPEFEVIPINPIDNPEQWEAAWPNLDVSASSAEQSKVAYKPVPIGGGIVVYYSTLFAPFASQIDELKTESPILPELFRTNYEVWIGYHAILQENSRRELPDINDEELEKILEQDRNRVATMQVKQARATAELMHKSISQKVSD